MSTRLGYDFYAQDTVLVARHLLGQRLVHRRADGSRRSGRIVETEAYLGVEDPAAHSFAGRRTARTEPMFAHPGTSYIYFIYGMHFCFNVVTMPAGNPQAVLVRALEVSEGLESMQRLKPQSLAAHLANGPGKLCAALELTRAENAVDLITSSTLWIEKDGAIADGDIIEGPRVGIGNRHDAVHWPLRFGIKNHPALSPAKFLNYLE